ncbi:MAG: hypothetical protein JW850_15810 [Thermoflexales bacterium]|nr:hypothetical protein [Thermoflexales bacterium]
MNDVITTHPPAPMVELARLLIEAVMASQARQQASDADPDDDGQPRPDDDMELS